MVLDVGCHPGGWTQVAVEITGGEGLVIGVDLLSSAPIDGAHLVTGDIMHDDTQSRIIDLLREGQSVSGEILPEILPEDIRQFKSIVSDISPSLTGQYDRDQAISMELVAMVFDFTMPLLAPGGSFVTKIFQGTGIEGIVNAAKNRFSRVQRYSPDASRNSSSEVYLVCKNRLPKPKKPSRGKSVAMELDLHLEKEGIIADGSEVEDDEKPAKTGFRIVPKRD